MSLDGIGHWYPLPPGVDLQRVPFPADLPPKFFPVARHNLPGQPVTFTIVKRRVLTQEESRRFHVSLLERRANAALLAADPVFAAELGITEVS